MTPIAVKERNLTEVDHLLDHRLNDGYYSPGVLADIRTNLVPAVQEAAMPFAVSKVEHPFITTPEVGGQRGTFMWLGKTAIEAAMSGYRFHRHPAARQRVGIEVDEAAYGETHQDPQVMKVFLSPRMSRKDASLAVARQEHLADEDAVRTSHLVVYKEGNIEKREMESLLVRDIPLEAWVAMLADPNNIFDKSILVDEPDSALSVMQVHQDLEIPLEKCPEGPITVVEAVIPHIADPALRRSVIEQLALFRGDQETLRSKAESIADRWLEFEVQLADSLASGYASPEIKIFIIGLQEHWGDEDLEIILAHQLPGHEYKMTRQLAAVLESAKQNTLWTTAGAATGNQFVLDQIDPRVVEQIIVNEELIEIARRNNMSTAGLETKNNKLIASQNVDVGGGCPGNNLAQFRNPDDKPESKSENPMDQKKWKKKTGECVVPGCPTRPGKVKVGPCGVCMGRCQPLFDKGIDPAKTIIKVSYEEEKAQSDEDKLAEQVDKAFEEQGVRSFEEVSQEAGKRVLAHV